MISKRQHQRRVQREAEKTLQLFTTTGNEISSENSQIVSCVEEDQQTMSNEENVEITLSDKLSAWFTKYKPTVECTRSLLRILKSENFEVPLSVRSLVGKKTVFHKRTVPPGEYVHVGIQNHLEHLSTTLCSELEDLIIDIGIDGLSLFKSSPKEVWPILGRIQNVPTTEVFLIGVYVGPKKPYNINCYLHDFVKEFSDLQMSGIFLKGKKINIHLRAIICDAPAKAFVCGIKGHNSFNGCTKCQQIGERVDNVNTYSIFCGESRTDEGFISRIYENYHLTLYNGMEMKLESIGIKMVSQFPVDSMHTIDLGITKKILTRIFDRKTILPVSPSSCLQISEDLCSLRPCIPREFARKPRTLIELSRWKATEFRQFLLYTGIVVLKDNIPSELYEHFLLLHLSYRILSSSTNGHQLERVQSFIQEFVQSFPVLYGRSSVSYNVHTLLHITECVKQFGPLVDFSAYFFENFMQCIKSAVRVPKHITQQICNAFMYRPLEKKEPRLGLKYINGNVKALRTAKGYFSIKYPDNICLLKDKIYLEIQEIIDEYKFKAKPYIELRSFYNIPVNSLDIGIALVEPTFDDKKVYYFHDIDFKVVKLPYKNSYVLIPEIHCLY
ncbi:uncharacterized protein [Musca autumnalis]|uniref:uncharacterized protein n=1 Tax=Musca autumnalis TaxID=221902 RepID=UPI003CFA6AB6